MLKESKNFEDVRTFPDVFERGPMHPSRSQQVSAHLRGYENLEHVTKTSRKLGETRASAVVDFEGVDIDVNVLVDAADVVLRQRARRAGNADRRRQRMVATLLRCELDA